MTSSSGNMHCTFASVTAFFPTVTADSTSISATWYWSFCDLSQNSLAFAATSDTASTFAFFAAKAPTARIFDFMRCPQDLVLGFPLLFSPLTSPW